MRKGRLCQSYNYPGATPKDKWAIFLASTSVIHVSEAARRYASALFDLAQDKGVLSDVHNDLGEFAKMAREDDDLAGLLRSPTWPRAQKAAALTELARKSGAHSLVEKFVGIMALNGRASEIGASAKAFDDLFAAQRGVKRVIARTAKPMTDEQYSRIENILAKSVGGEVEITSEIDPSLIGGIQLRIGSRLVDASIAARLNRMNTAMKGAL